MSIAEEGFWNEHVIVSGTYTRAELAKLALGEYVFKLIAGRAAAPASPSPSPVAAESGEERLQNAISVNAVTETLPWEHESVGLSPIDEPKPGDAPRGKPSLAHVHDVFMWIWSNDKHREKILDTLRTRGKDGDVVKKSLGDFSYAVGCLPIFDSARWLFTVMCAHTTSQHVFDAFAGIDATEFDKDMRKWGLDQNEIAEDTECHKQMLQHSFMPDIVNGMRLDGVRGIRGSAAKCMRDLRTVFDGLPFEKREKMYEYILTNESDVGKALAPLKKAMTAFGVGDTAELFDYMVRRGFVSVSKLALVFRESWKPIYDALTACLDTVGPRPRWLEV